MRKLIDRLAYGWLFRRQVEETEHELSLYTDRELNELGLVRDDVARIAREEALRRTQPLRAFAGGAPLAA